MYNLWSWIASIQLEWYLFFGLVLGVGWGCDMSVVMLLASHLVWFIYFTHNWYPTDEILSFFLVCVWLVPFAFFISLTSNEDTLPYGSTISSSTHLSLLRSNQTFHFCFIFHKIVQTYYIYKNKKLMFERFNWLIDWLASQMLLIYGGGVVHVAGEPLDSHNRRSGRVSWVVSLFQHLKRKLEEKLPLGKFKTTYRSSEKVF